MKRKITFSIQYMLLTWRLDMVWLPLAFWGLFAILAWMLFGEPAGKSVTMGYFGLALPLIGGILGAYAVLEDPALELQFATPRPVWLMLLERLLAILLLLAACALSYQVVIQLLGYDLEPLGGLAARQLAWLAPTLAFTAFGVATALANRQSSGGAALIGMIWIVQLLLRGWFLENRWGQYFLLMMGSNYPDHPAVRANEAVLVGLGLLLTAAAWALLRRQERYL